MNALIVDDSDLLQSRLKKALLLLDDSMEIIQTNCCEEASKLFLFRKPDIVILDIALPDGSGIDLLRTFKNESPEVIIAMLTNFPTTEFRSTCLSLGADYFFDKSNLIELIKTIQPLILKLSTFPL
jgi:DNA-binding NarL/FixJ family response regulator